MTSSMTGERDAWLEPVVRALREPVPLYRSWWAHDGAWYQAVAREFGYPTANELNRRCLRVMAERCMSGLVRKLALKPEELDLALLARLYLAVTRVMWPDEWVDTEVEIAEPDSLEVTVHKNFALALLSQADSLEHYECACLEIRAAWFRVLGCRVQQGVRACKLRGSAVCRFWARAQFPGGEGRKHGP